MQLRAPEDDGTIDALIEQTQRTNSIVVIYYADPSAFAEPKWSDSWGETPEPTVRDDIVSRIANEYSASQQSGGRPLMVLRIDRDQPGMDVICAKRGIRVFPTLQVWSRGTMEIVDPYVLEDRLLALGIRSRGGSSTRGSSGPRAARSVPTGEVDFFGIGTSKPGGRAARLPVGDAPSRGDLGTKEPDPLEALAGADGRSHMHPGCTHVHHPASNPVHPQAPSQSSRATRAGVHRPPRSARCLVARTWTTTTCTTA